jgi:hypothetical protein
MQASAAVPDGRGVGGPDGVLLELHHEEEGLRLIRTFSRSTMSFPS